VLLLPVITVLLSYANGSFVLINASYQDGFVFALVSGAVLFGLIFLCRSANPILGLAIVLLVTLVVSGWGFLISYDVSKDGFWRAVQASEAGDYPDTWKVLERDPLYDAQVQSSLGDNATGFFGYLRLQVKDGIWNWERQGPRRLGSSSDWVHRQGFWVVFAWASQFLMLLVGNLFGTMGAMAIHDDRRTVALQKDRMAGGSATRKDLAKLLGVREPVLVAPIVGVMLAVTKNLKGEAAQDQTVARQQLMVDRYYRGSRTQNISVLLLESLDVLVKFFPARDFYQLASLLLRAYRKLYFSPLLLPPLPELDMSGIEVPKPDVGATHALIINPHVPFYESTRYTELTRQSPESIPDQVLVPLLKLALEDVNPKSYEYLPVTRPLDLLQRVGPRLWPALTCVLRTSRNQSATSLFSLLTSWPEELASPVFRAAFRSGWNDCARYLPDELWAKALIADFSESPFGAPHYRF